MRFGRNNNNSVFKVLVLSPFDPYFSLPSQFAASKRQTDILKSISEVYKVEFTYITQSEIVRDGILYSKIPNLILIRKNFPGIFFEIFKVFFKKEDVIIVFYPGDWKSILISILAKIKSTESWVVINEAPEVYEKNYSGIRKFIRILFYKHFIKLYNNVITPTQILGNRITKSYQKNKILPLVFGENDKIQEDCRLQINLEKVLLKRKIFFTGDLEKGKDNIELIMTSLIGFKDLIELHIYGTTSSEERLDNLKKKSEILNLPVFFHGHVNYEQLQNEMINADMFILLRENNLQNMNGFPSKLSDYIKSKKPIIINDFGEIGIYLDLSFLNIVELSEKDIDEKIKFIIENYDLSLQKSNHLYDLLREKYSYSSIGNYLLN